MIRTVFFAFATLVSFLASAQVDLVYYLPESITYNPDIPTPHEILGYEVGEWHVTHDQLVYYMYALNAASDRISLVEHGRSYENRPLLALMITSPENHGNLEQIRQQHVTLTDPEAATPIQDAKLVHWMGYSVHGNEPSGANAALLAAYHLAAAQGSQIENMLRDMVILLDPAFNPDGMQRFSTWVNMHKSSNLVSDPNSREFGEVWPGGRTNHYWFDLNRDWLPVQLNESQGRIKLFHDWKPNVLTDHHEMGTNSTFFFQPGVPARKFPLTPAANVTMTERIAEYHANDLDSIGSLYFSEEGFDDYYIGKGSTYPDINGAVGILFEQASSRGHVQENQYGKISFPFTIRNHFVTSLSTLRAAYHLKDELLQMQQDFYRESIALAKADPVKAYAFGSATDPRRAFHLMELIQKHDIKVYPLRQSISKGEESFHHGSYLIPTNQPQYRLIKAMFERRTTFQDSLFYDVSTWTLPDAFNLDFAELTARDYTLGHLADENQQAKPPKGSISGTSNYAYIFEPHGYYTYRAIMRLLNAGVITEVSHALHTTSDKTFARGSVIIPIGLQYEKKDTIASLIRDIAEKDGIDVHALSTGLAVSGSDLGSRKIEVLKKPEVAILVGEGISSYEAGETWHLLDQRMAMQVTLLPVRDVHRVDLSRYTKLVMVNGSYGALSNGGIENLKKWISNGGVVVAWKRGGKWLADQKLAAADYLPAEPDTSGYKNYADLNENRGARVIGGAIFEVRLDLGHPLTYGMDRDRMPVFRDHSLMMKKARNPYANPVVYAKEPLLSGYVHKNKLEDLSGTPAVTISKFGKGRVVAFTDNPNFRGFWYGTNKLFMNALFFGQTISSSAAEE